MNAFKIMAFVLVFASSVSSLSARMLRIPLPDELAEQSTLICNGQVESIAETGKDKVGSNPWDSVTHLTAKIKVLHVFKGQAPAEIELHYNSGPNPPNGPIQIQLMKDSPFRFFLKNGPSTLFYIGVLDGKMDDGFAVVPLAPTEPDDSTYISKAEAMNIATKWIKDNHPELAPVTQEPSQDSPNAKPTSSQSRPRPAYPCTRLYPAFEMNGSWDIFISEISANGAVTSSKHIIIMGDRIVNDQSWNRKP